MIKTIAFLVLFQSAGAWAEGNRTDLAICQRPQVCPPIPASQLDGTVTVQGNSFNGPLQLVQLLGNGKLPVLDGSNLTNIPSGSPGGLNMQVQFSSAGTFAGDPGFVWDYNTHRLELGGFATIANGTLEVWGPEGTNLQVWSDNSTSSLYARIVNSPISGAFLSADAALMLGGDGPSGNPNITMLANGFTGFNNQNNPLYAVDVNGDVNVTGSFLVNGAPFSGSTPPGGSNPQVQFNDSGVFAGVASFVFNKTLGPDSNGNLNLGASNTTNTRISIAAPTSDIAGPGGNMYWSNETTGSAWFRITDTPYTAAVIESNTSLFLTGAIVAIPSGTLIIGEYTDTSGANLEVNGTINATSNFLAGGTAGITAGPFTTITSITVVGGIVTDLQGF